MLSYEDNVRREDKSKIPRKLLYKFFYFVLVLRLGLTVWQWLSWNLLCNQASHKPTEILFLPPEYQD